MVIELLLTADTLPAKKMHLTVLPRRPPSPVIPFVEPAELREQAIRTIHAVTALYQTGA